jgi:hypothetical protein
MLIKNNLFEGAKVMIVAEAARGEYRKGENL